MQLQVLRKVFLLSGFVNIIETAPHWTHFEGTRNAGNFDLQVDHFFIFDAADFSGYLIHYSEEFGLCYFTLAFTDLDREDRFPGSSVTGLTIRFIVKKERLWDVIKIEEKEPCIEEALVSIHPEVRECAQKILQTRSEKGIPNGKE